MSNGIYGGIIIVGSLFWDEGGPGWSFEKQVGGGEKLIEVETGIRPRWRKENLNMAEAIQIRFPTQYGRLSSSSDNAPIATMTVSPSYPMGVSYFVPFHQPLSGYKEVVDQAEKLARAESMKPIKKEDGTVMQPIIKPWGVIALMTNPKISPWENAREELEKKWNWAKYRPSYKHEEFWKGIAENQRAVNKQGRLTVLAAGTWLKAIDPAKQKFLDKVEFALCAVTRPDEKPLSIHDIAVAVASDHSRKYFKNNYEKGLYTAFDEVIMMAAQSPEYIEIGCFELPRSSDDLTMPFQNRSIFNPTLNRKYYLTYYNGSDNPLQIRYFNCGNSKDFDQVWALSKSKLPGIDPLSIEKGQVLRFQKDGNLVIYSNYVPGGSDKDYPEKDIVWSSQTTKPAATETFKPQRRLMRLYQDGTLEIWAGENRLWSSDPEKAIVKESIPPENVGWGMPIPSTLP